MEFVERVKELLVGKVIVDVIEYTDNARENGDCDGEGVQLLLDDGTKVDIGINYSDVDLYVQEHES